MSYVIALLLGIVQGLLEFSPVSSSGILLALENIFHYKAGGMAFTLFLHLGTLIPLFIVYGETVHNVAQGVSGLLGGSQVTSKKMQKKALSSRRFALLLFISAIPCIAAIFFFSTINRIGNNTTVISILFMLSGVVMLLCARNAGEKKLSGCSVLDALILGCGYFLSALPGISGTGLVISFGNVRNIQIKVSYQFQILLTIPSVIVGIIICLINQDIFSYSIVPECLIGMAASAVTGFFGIRIAQTLLFRLHTKAFPYVNLGLGMILLLFSLVS